MLKSKAAIILFSAVVIMLIYSACLYFLVPSLTLKKVKSAAAQNGYDLRTVNWSGSGINKISFDSLIVINAANDTLLTIRHGKIGYSVFRYLTARFPVNLISIDSLSVFKKPGIDSASASTVAHQSETETGFAARLFHLENKIIKNLPEKVNIRHAEITILKNKNLRQWSIDDFEWDNSKMKGLVKTENGAEIAVNANITNGPRTYELNARMKGYGLIAATLDSQALQFSFRSASLILKKNNWSKSELVTHCLIKTEGLQLFHWRLSQDTIKINRFETSQHAVVHDNSLALAPSSSLQINDISINTELIIERNEKTSIQLKAGIPVMPAQAFFNSLPDGLFQSFKNIKAEGELGYTLNFSVDLSLPDSLIFESAFNGKKIRLQQFGEVNPYRLNDSFEHTAYEKGRPVRRITVGTDNPHFVSYSQIPAALVNCVLTAEDGSFFSHSGFNEEAFRQSIITNIKEKRFARGGSTISMQLVKNLYLGRDKNISRKMEEALWVWFIENKRMVSKERMMEIYLNIIEWGPDVYGIGEAAQYYFNKKADQLTLNECIFLAGIIPNPKYFRFAFDKEGNLRNYFQSFFKIVSERLLMKEKITEEEFLSVSPVLKISGRAAALVMPADSLPDFDVEEPEEEIH